MARNQEEKPGLPAPATQWEQPAVPITLAVFVTEQTKASIAATDPLKIPPVLPHNYSCLLMPPTFSCRSRGPTGSQSRPLWLSECARCHSRCTLLCTPLGVAPKTHLCQLVSTAMCRLEATPCRLRRACPQPGAPLLLVSLDLAQSPAMACTTVPSAANTSSCLSTLPQTDS